MSKTEAAFQVIAVILILVVGFVGLWFIVTTVDVVYNTVVVQRYTLQGEVFECTHYANGDMECEQVGDPEVGGGGSDTMKKLLILAILAVLAYLVWQEIGMNSLLFVLPVVAGVLYGANGSRYVETPYIPQEGDDEATVMWNGKGGRPYINKDGVTYEMTRKGWKYNFWRRQDGEK